MKLHSSIAALSSLFFTISVFSPVLADLKSDRQALLNFSASIIHTKRLNWNASTPVCSSWIGVTCNAKGTRVVSIRLPGIGLAGSIPANSIGKLHALRDLSLRSNLLNGNLPSDIPSIPSLQFLYLQRNNFSGELPSTFSHKLVVFDLSSNSISGNIPTTIQNLTRLAKLKLQNNSISGAIPNLNLPRLKLLNLSYNNLNGSIPNSLQKYPYSSFVGNSLLCGPPLNPCYTTPSPSPTAFPASSPTIVQNQNAKRKRKLGVDSIIALAIGISAVLFLFALVMFICCLKKRRAKGSGVLKVKAPSSEKAEKPKDFGSGVHDAEKNKLFFFPGCSYSFDLEDLLRASAEILGKGNNGTTYKAVLDEGSTTVVVKRLKEILVGKKEFEQQMEIVGRVGQHQNVAPLRAYYYSKDEKLLVYNYMPVGSLFTRLHGFRGAESTPLNWDLRVKISLGAAKGIAHIHSEGGPKCIHGNIKSSNVLLSQDLEACITDFGLAQIVNFPPIISRILGYRAPEAIDTRKLTQKSDVYSFGVLLLEMLTGKIPIRYPGHNEVVDLPRWVRSVVREEWTSEVFDVEILRQTYVEEEMVQMLQIALACVSKVPDSRPNMEEVVKMIEDVRPPQTKTRPSSESDYSNVQTP
ncbi:putative inactive receptor kinase [Morus notabilis]|uniref:Putative inactive receptor kinase n=2 Tax=Morus notabilis TaxID=981085 RepID=W9S9Q7_9ROSA|nr:putative inactive receptor kinase [Morus notabilis]